MGYRKKNKQNAVAKNAQSAENKAAKPAGVGKDGKNLKDYVKVIRQECEAFENYYRAQGICDSDAEFDQFLEKCKEGLPCGVRLNGTWGKQGMRLFEQFQGLMTLPTEEEWKKANPSITTAPQTTDDGNKTSTPGSSPEKATGSAPMEVEGESPIKADDSKDDISKEETTPSYVLRPNELEWYPRKLAFQWDYLNAKVIKKDKNFRWLKQFLMNHECYGAIQRQETVSMIPPHFLDIQKDDLVLDMCAAPGSKTCQMLEKLHWDAQATLGKGGVLANDVEWKRANMLTHQVQRIGSPGVGVLNTDACFFPALKKNDGSIVHFDKVLCDVPCSGDGTIRKTPNIWRTWTIKDGMGLHFRQQQILWRGLDLLAVGGTLVYSTCSLNPMENESVIHTMLEKCQGAVELVEPPAGKGFVSKDGKRSWKVPNPEDKSGKSFFDSYESVPQSLKDSNKIRQSMFPPAADSPHLGAIEKCCRRFLPHLMNTGGFFVTIITKKAQLPKQAVREARRQEWENKSEEAKAKIIKEKTDLEEAEKKAQEESSKNSSTEDVPMVSEESPASNPGASTETAAESADEAQPPTKKLKNEEGEAVPTPTNKGKEGMKKKKEMRDEATQSNSKEPDVFLPIPDEEWTLIRDFYELPESAKKYLFKRPKIHGNDKI